MHSLDFSHVGSQMHINGFPDAVKVIQLQGPNAKRLSDLNLHIIDLNFANSCLTELSNLANPYGVIHEALWRSAIVCFTKCFGKSKARFQLSPDKILRSAPPDAMTAFNYFRSLRNKHLVHDDNSNAQSSPGAAINDGSKPFKIEKIFCTGMIAVSLNPGNHSNLKLLIQMTRDWVESEFDKQCELLTSELEKQSYESLFATQSLTMTTPYSDEIHRTRAGV